MQGSDRTKRRRTLLFAGAAAGAVAAFLVPVPSDSREVAAIMDLLHAPVFMLAAILSYRVFLGSSAPLGKIVIVGLLLVGLGALLELTQGFFGRHPTWHDATSNAVGALVGIIAAKASVTGSAKQLLGAMVPGGLLLLGVSVQPLTVLADSLLQRLQMPQLGSFEYSTEVTRWVADEHCTLRRVRRQATDGSWSLALELDPGRYPGASLHVASLDWSSYQELVCDLSLDGSQPLNLVIKIEDVQHNGDPRDRYHRRVHLEHGTHRLRIPLAEVKAAPRSRDMDLSRIVRIQFFTVDLGSPTTVYLDNIHLR